MNAVSAELVTAPTLPALPALVPLLVFTLAGVACGRMRRAALPLVASVLVLTGAAAHALTPIAQERSVHGTQNHWYYNNSGQLVSEVHDSESFSAPDFGAFVARTDGYHLPLVANDTASQVSAIQAERIHAEGRADATPVTRFLEIHDISGESSFSTTFELSESRSYTLTGHVDLSLADCDAGSDGSIRLTSVADGVIAEVAGTLVPGSGDPPPGTVCDPTGLGCHVSLPLSASGVLSPGTYTLEAGSYSFGHGAVYPSDVCATSWASALYAVDFRVRQVGEVPALPAPLLPLLGFALAGAARRRLRLREGW